MVCLKTASGTVGIVQSAMKRGPSVIASRTVVDVESRGWRSWHCRKCDGCGKGVLRPCEGYSGFTETSDD